MPIVTLVWGQHAVIYCTRQTQNTYGGAASAHNKFQVYNGRPRFQPRNRPLLRGRQFQAPRQKKRFNL